MADNQESGSMARWQCSGLAATRTQLLDDGKLSELLKGRGGLSSQGRAHDN